VSRERGHPAARTAASNHDVIVAGWVMAVPTQTAKARMLA
jgi:hypothetical protein